MGREVRFVQRCRVNHGSHSGQAIPYEGALENGPHPISECRCFSIKAKHRASRGAEGPNNPFAEVTRRAGNQNGHLTSPVTSR